MIIIIIIIIIITTIIIVLIIIIIIIRVYKQGRAGLQALSVTPRSQPYTAVFSRSMLQKYMLHRWLGIEVYKKCAASVGYLHYNKGKIIMRRALFQSIKVNILIMIINDMSNKEIWLRELLYNFFFPLYLTNRSYKPHIICFPSNKMISNHNLKFIFTINFLVVNLLSSSMILMNDTAMLKINGSV